MSEFETSAEITEIVVSQQALRSAREQVESGLGSPSVGGGSAGGRSSLSSMERRRYRWERQRTNDIEDVLDVLFSLEDDLGGGGGGGGDGWLVDILGDLGETAGLGAAATALGGAATALGGSATALTGAAAALGGSSVLDAVDDVIDEDQLEKIDTEELDRNLQVEKPDWVPIEVEGSDDPRIVGGPVRLPLDYPKSGVPVDYPRGGLPIDTSPLPLPVEDVEPIDVNVSVDGRPTGDTGGGGYIPPDIPDSGGGSGGPLSPYWDFQEGMRRRVLEPIPGIGEPAAEASRSLERRVRGGGGPTDVSSRVDVEVGGFDDLRRSLERSFGQQVDEVMGEVDGVRSDLENLERSLTGRR